MDYCITKGLSRRSLSTNAGGVIVSGIWNGAAAWPALCQVIVISNSKPVAIWEKHCRIVLGIDVGVTRTAVAYSYLYKGGAAYVHYVAEWPGQKTQMPDGEIPTHIYYDNREVSDDVQVNFH